MARLRMEARAHPEYAWRADADIADARNAHVTNTPWEMLYALGRPYDHLEGDVRMREGELVMAHSGLDLFGLSMREWVSLGKLAGRALKIDVKEGDAVLPAVDLAREMGVPDSHIVINVSAATDDTTLDTIRSTYPDAWVNLSPRSDYTDGELAQLAEKSGRVGGNVQFPLRWDLVTQDVVDTLLPHGRVAIWNDPQRGPDDAEAERKRLRAMGVNGTIDLR